MFPVMEIIIGGVLFKAFMKGSQKSSFNNSKLRIRRAEIKSVRGKISSEKPCHNSPGTPIERLSLNTTVMLAEFIALVLEI